MATTKTQPEASVIPVAKATPPTNPITPAPVSPQPVTTLLNSVNPGAVYSPTNIQQIDIPSNRSAMDMKLSDLEDKLSNANSIADLNQIGIMNQTKAMGVLTGEAAYRSKLDTARINAFNSLYNNRLIEEQRKEAERQAFISQYGADPSQRPKGMSKREFAKAIQGGQFSNLLTTDARIKNASLAKSMSTGSGTSEIDKTLATIQKYNTAGVDVPQILLDKLDTLGGVGSQTSTSTLNPAGQAIQDKITVNKGTDGYSNPNDYMATKDEWMKTQTNPASSQTFDQQFGHLLNPRDAQGMGVIQSSTLPNVPQEYVSILSDKTPEQQQAFSTLSPTDQSNVSQLLNGDVLLSDLMASRGVQGSAMRQKLLEKARMIDPTFSENVNKQRYQFKQQWNNPNAKQFVTRTAINTAIGHLAEVNTTFQELAKIDAGVLTLKGNALKNWISKNEGTGAVQAFELARDNFASEIATVYKGGVPDQVDIAARKDQLDAAMSAGGLVAVANTAAQMLGSKINSTASEYKAVMGKNPDEPLVNNFSLEALYNSGIDTSPIAKDLQAQGYQVDPKYLKTPPKTTSDPDEWLKSTTVDGGHVSGAINDYLTQIGY